MTTTSEFYVEDMTCGHCERAVREALEAHLPGAIVSVDLGSHHVRVDGDATQAEAAIREAGYTPVVVTA